MTNTTKDRYWIGSVGEPGEPGGVSLFRHNDGSLIIMQQTDDEDAAGDGRPCLLVPRVHPVSRKDAYNMADADQEAFARNVTRLLNAFEGEHWFRVQNSATDGADWVDGCLHHDSESEARQIAADILGDYDSIQTRVVLSMVLPPATRA